MLTSKQRAELRAQANTLETTLMVGKDGVTEAVAAEADRLLTAHELVKGKVLETALMSPREVSDALCEATKAEGIACVGNKFVIWRFSEKCQEARNQTGRAKRKETPKSKADPVGKGVRARRAASRAARRHLLVLSSCRSSLSARARHKVQVRLRHGRKRRSGRGGDKRRAACAARADVDLRAALQQQVAGRQTAHSAGGMACPFAVSRRAAAPL